MELKIEITDYDARRIFDKMLEEKVREVFEPLISTMLKKQVNTKKVVSILESQVKNTLETTRYDRWEGPLVDVMDKKLSEIAQSITDEELKNIILKRFMYKMD